MRNQLTPSLFADQLHHRFAQRGHAEHVAVDRVSLSVLPGRIVVIQGPSGSGKSTLMMILAGMLRPTGGRVELLGTDPYQMAPNARSQFRRTNLGVVLPSFGLLPYLSAKANLGLGYAGPDRDDRINELLTQLGLAHKAAQLTDRMSSGERRRLLVARALVHRPQLLLADEPTANLDRENAEIVRKLIVGYVQDASPDTEERLGPAALIVTHESPSMFSADRVYTMREGCLDHQPDAL